MVRWRALAEEVGSSTCDSAALRRVLGAEDTSANACVYVLLRAVDRFRALHSRFPGCYDGCALLMIGAQGCCLLVLF